jgi:hypothetical protein
MSVSRKNQKLNVIYVVTPRVEKGLDEGVFFTPDGEGRIWFKSVEEAKEETGLTKVVHLDSEPTED